MSLNYEKKLLADLHFDLQKYGFTWCSNKNVIKLLKYERDDIEVKNYHGNDYYITLKEEK